MEEKYCKPRVLFIIVLCFVAKFLPPTGFLMALPLLFEAKDGTVQLIKDYNTLISKYSRFYSTVSSLYSNLKVANFWRCKCGSARPITEVRSHVWHTVTYMQPLKWLRFCVLCVQYCVVRLPWWLGG